jgi:hypothetical protein
VDLKKSLHPNRRRAFRIGLAVTLATSSVIFGGVANPAQAATGPCPGTRIGRTTATDPDTHKLVGELVIYYDSSTKMNCARMNHLGAAVGIESYTKVKLDICSQTLQGFTCTVIGYAQDYGDYSSYAGPVKVLAPGRCIHASGILTAGTYQYLLDSATADTNPGYSAYWCG